MKLDKAQIETYGSIVDSGVVNIEDRVTVLIGKNEQGKTTFLKALSSTGNGTKYSPGDLPNHLSPSMDLTKGAQIRIVTLWLRPEPGDEHVIAQIITEPSRVKLFKIIKFYDGHVEYFLVKDDDTEEAVQFKAPEIQLHVDRFKEIAENLKTKLNAHSTRQPEFAPHLPQASGHIDQFVKANFSESEQVENLVKTFATGMSGVPAQDPPIKEDIAAAMKEISATQTALKNVILSDPKKLFEKLLPRFVYHSTLPAKIPNEVRISEFIKNPEVVSLGMLNLCGVAGLSMQKIQELANATDNQTRERHEDTYTRSVSGGINEFWRQETYKVHFRFDKEKMSVSISDHKYSPRIAPSDRSDGFQWYLSFYAAIINQVSQAGAKVFLLDNPGLELHADGQKDIKRFLDQKLPVDTQVIYVTHSPAMIDAHNLEQIRQVEHLGEKDGTKIGPLKPKAGTDFDLLDPARTAIGASIATSLVTNELNILVEGAADKPVLEGALKAYSEKEKQILVNGSLSETKDGFLPRFYERANLPYAILLDSDDGGRKLAALLKSWDIPESKILNLGTVISRTGEDFALEDVVSAAFYHKAVEEAYPELRMKKPEAAKGKRASAYETFFKGQGKIKFSKKRVADRLKKLILDGKADKESKDNLRKVIEGLIAMLEAPKKEKNQPKQNEPVAE